MVTQTTTVHIFCQAFKFRFVLSPSFSIFNNETVNNYYRGSPCALKHLDMDTVTSHT